MVLVSSNREPVLADNSYSLVLLIPGRLNQIFELLHLAYQSVTDV